MAKLLVVASLCAVAESLRAVSPTLRPRRCDAPVLSGELQSLSSLLANEAAVPVDAVLLSQLGVASGGIIGGYGLEFFGNVEEPKEAGVEEGVPDLYRDTLLRYCGYANEVGEAFRPLVPVEVVYFSYVIAITYILADTLDKGRKGAAAASDNALIFATLGALDTFLWQMLASVVFPSFCINRLVTLLISLQATQDLPGLLTNEFVPTVAGLLAIPLLITPLDVLAHWVLNGSFRTVKAKVAN